LELILVWISQIKTTTKYFFSLENYSSCSGKYFELILMWISQMKTTTTTKYFLRYWKPQLIFLENTWNSFWCEFCKSKQQQQQSIFCSLENYSSCSGKYLELVLVSVSPIKTTKNQQQSSLGYVLIQACSQRRQYWIVSVDCERQTKNAMGFCSVTEREGTNCIVFV
jgi:hypothetical protein